MSDLIRRLRGYHTKMRGAHPSICDEAAERIAALEAELAKLTRDAIQVRERYRHKGRGTTYALVGEASLQTSHAVVEGMNMVVYRADADGRLWGRPWIEFADGRFERLPDPARAL
jgi:muconolactone delta-isomerase